MSKGLFGGMFDFDGNGETGLFELGVEAVLLYELLSIFDFAGKKKTNSKLVSKIACCFLAGIALSFALYYVPTVAKVILITGIVGGLLFWYCRNSRKNNTVSD